MVRVNMKNLFACILPPGHPVNRREYDEQDNHTVDYFFNHDKPFLLFKGVLIRSPFFTDNHMAWWRLVDQRPEYADLLHGLDEVDEADRLDHISVDTQPVACFQVLGFVRRGQDNHRNKSPLLARLELLQDLDAVHAGHLRSSRITTGLPGGRWANNPQR